MITIPLSEKTGVVMRHNHFASRYIPPRHVDIWHPPDYSINPEVRYPVIYMHDGQNLFDPASSYIGVDWGMDEAMMGLMEDAASSGAIIVGIWNSAQRWREYMPDKPLIDQRGRSLLTPFIQSAGGTPLSSLYLKFITQELKPFIDATYRTLPDQPYTLIMGSSMGGLISLYAVTEYPEIFGGAACLSTHWPIGQNIMVDYLGSALPKPGRHLLYFDYGTGTLDADYEPYQQRMDGLLQTAGYEAGRDWLTLKFDGAEHSERAWRARVHFPLRFLLQSKR